MLYEETIIMRDDCHILSDTCQQVLGADGTLVLTRKVLRREGDCAKVLTPITFTGHIEESEQYRRIELRIINEASLELARFILK